MIIKKTILFVVFISLLFCFTNCNLTTNSSNHSVPENQDNSNYQEDQENVDNQQKLPEQQNQTNEGNKDDLEDKKPLPPPATEDENNLSEYQPEPDAITDSLIIKLNRGNINYESNSNQLYLMLRFMGKSSRGFWQKEYGDKIARPKGFVLNFNGINESTVLNFNNLEESIKNKVGYVTDFDLGFTDFSGNKFYTTFYYSDNNMSVKIDGNKDITFTFASFAIWDPTINGEFFHDAHPDFVRYPNNKFKIKIPMKDYDPLVHKNIAYITVYFEPDKGTTDNLFPYVVVLDGFEEKSPKSK